MRGSGNRSTRRRVVGATALVAVTLLAATLGLRLPVGVTPAAAHDTGGDFVTRSGGQLLLAGQPYVFHGINLYNANSDGWCRDALSDAAFAGALDDIGLGTTRPVPGHPTPEPSPFIVDGHGVIRAWFFQTLAANKVTGAREWATFDRTLQIARDKGYKVIATLTDQWGECGTDTNPTYGYKSEAWYTTGYKAPDPGMAGGYPGWKSYYDWVAEVVARYALDPTILAWQLINEAEVNPNGAFQPCPPGNGPRDTLMAWAADVSGLVRSLDSGHLISLGTIGSGQCGTSGSQYQDVHALPNIDLCEVHDYTPNQAIPGDQWNGFGVRVQQCAALNKPLFVGEAGIKPTDVGGSLEDRAMGFRAKIGAQTAAGIDGFIAWNFSPAGSTLDNFDIGPGDPALDELRSPGSILVVNSPDDVDDGACNFAHCSLREAIVASNGSPERDLVALALGGAAPHVVSPATPLPPVTAPAFIDGTTELDSAGTPTAVIDGASAGPAGNGLVIAGNDVDVRGLRITGFGGSGIVVTGAEVRIEANRIDGNGADGVTTLEPAQHVTITANSIAGNGDLGIDVGDDGPTMNSIGGPVGPPPPPEPFRLNVPDLTSANPTTDHVVGSLGSLPGTYRIELFRVAGCDPSLYGEGDLFMASTNLTIAGTGSFGSATFDIGVPGGIAEGQVFTATATNSAGTTSELSFCAIAQSAGPHTYVVNSTAPGFDLVCDTVCTLLDAYTGALFNPGPDTIAFDIQGPGPHVIPMAFELLVEDGLVIDGTTQPGYAGAPLVAFDGSTAEPGNGLVLQAGAAVRGIAIGGYDDHPSDAAVILAGDGATIEASYVGLALDGVTAMPSSIGVLVQSGSHARVGGHDAGQGNVISGNGVGIQVDGPAAYEPTIEGNRIGTNAAGTAAVANGVGIRFVGVNGGWVGGPYPGSGNLISGNTGAGLELGQDTQAAKIAGNRIGTDVTGLADLGNAVGILVSTGTAAASTESNLIGEGGVGNVISGNDVAGVLFVSTSRPATVLQANTIGLGSDGSTPVPNAVGVLAGSGTTMAWVNDGIPETANVIAGNVGAGVLVTDGATGVIVGANEIRDNGGLGIDLGDDGVTPNDPLDSDAGANNGQNAPVITSAVAALGQTTIDGTLDSFADGLFALFLYASPTCDPSGQGEGEAFLGTVELVTDEFGHAAFSAVVGEAPVGSAVSAVAIAVHSSGQSYLDMVADTSEFSPCITASGVATTLSGNQTATFTTTSGSLSVTFPADSNGGVTTVTTPTAAPALPAGVQFGDPPQFFEIETTATFGVGSQVKICVTYDEASFIDESGARLLHYADPPGAWEDITSFLDVNANLLCGMTDSLSPFAVTERNAFEGFASPVDDPPVVNRAKAGSAIPVKFSLVGGDLGLEIFAPGSPSVRATPCGSSAYDSVEQTVAAGSSYLTFDPVTGLYTYVWKTDKAWRGCRALVLTFRDGSTATAWFEFRK